jgi:hypothetical protein
MWNDDDRQTGMADAFANHLRERRERRADESDCRDTEIFERGRVTRGPGGRGSSMADTIDDRIALRRHLGGIGRCNA